MRASTKAASYLPRPSTPIQRQENEIGRHLVANRRHLVKNSEEVANTSPTCTVLGVQARSRKVPTSNRVVEPCPHCASKPIQVVHPRLSQQLPSPLYFRHNTTSRRHTTKSIHNRDSEPCNGNNHAADSTTGTSERRQLTSEQGCSAGNFDPTSLLLLSAREDRETILGNP